MKGGAPVCFPPPSFLGKKTFSNISKGKVTRGVGLTLDKMLETDNKRKERRYKGST